MTKVKKSRKKTVPSTPKRLTAEEQLILRNKVLAETQRIEAITSDENQIIKEFFSKFTKCESVCKIALAAHHLARYNKEAKVLDLSMNVIPFALQYAGYNFDNTLLARIFGSSVTAGSRSCKKIRDAIFHSCSRPAINELVTRKNDLFTDMDSFIDYIKTFDAAAL